MVLDWLDDEINRWDSLDLRRHLVIRSGKLGPTIVVDGRRYVNFGSNDYLGLASDPRLDDAIQKAVLRGGWGSGASPLIVGRTSLHAELERNLATYLQSEAALLFPTGFAANQGTIPALVSAEDVIFSDAFNHASIIDGCRLSGAKIVVYPHADLDFLQSALREHPSARRRLVVTDSLFSMDGDVAPLSDLVEIAEQHRAMLMVDEAHALGVFGNQGRGVADAQGVADRVSIRVATLSKSLGCHGGFVVGSRRLIDYLSNRARSYVFSTAAPAASAAAALTALRLIRAEPQRATQLLERASGVRAELQRQGWNTGGSESQIIPVIVGEASTAVSLAMQLKQDELWVPCIRPPSVPHGASCLRISLSFAHSDNMIGRLLSALRMNTTSRSDKSNK